MSQPEREVAETLGAGPRPAAGRIRNRDKLRALAAELAIAEERERRRIASGLHDQVGQLLGIAKVRLGEALAAGPVEEVAKPVSDARGLLDRAIREIRGLTFELSSPVLHELGFEAALEALAERMEDRHGMACRFERNGAPAALAEEMAVLVCSIVRELLWNVVKHARARRTRLVLSHEGPRLRIVIEDDGVGFDPTRVFDRLSDTDGLGLFGARERLEYLAGSLEVDSAPGRGTRVVLTLPPSR